MKLTTQDSGQIPPHPLCNPPLSPFSKGGCRGTWGEAGDYIFISLYTYLLACIFLFMIILFPIESHSQEVKGEDKQPWQLTENNTFVEIEGVPLYKIGPGDLLEVDILVGTTVEKYTPEVRPNGLIVLPVLDVKVIGLTTYQAEERIKEELSRYVKVPRVEVRIKEYRSKKVVVMGAIGISPHRVSGQGVYYLRGKTSFLELITNVGGPLPNAAMDRIQLRRMDGSVLVLNFLKIVAEGNIKENVILDAGDEIYVPSIEVAENKVLVFGEVKKPGIYPKKPGMNLLDAIALADGYTNYAVLKNTAVIRSGNPNSQILVANLDRLIKKGDLSQNILLANNDIVYVPRSLIGDWNVFIEKIRPTLQLLVLPLTVAVEVKYLGD